MDIEIWSLSLELRQDLWRFSDYTPSVEQLAAHMAIERKKLAAGGERAGKTRWAAEEGITWLPGCGEGDEIWIVGPDYYLAQPEFETMLHGLARSPFLEAESVSQPKMGSWTMRMVTGTSVVTKTSNDPRTLAGKAPAGVIMAEAAQQTYEAYLRLVGRVAEKRGPLILSGTFEGSFGWYAELWAKWQAANLDGGKSFSLPTWSNVSIYPGGREDPEILRLEATYPHDVFMERLGAVPCPPATLVYRGFSYLKQVRELVLPKDVRAQLWIDPGFAGAYAVLIVYIEKAEVFVFDEVYARGVVVQDIIKRCKEKTCWPRVGRIIMDEAGQQHPAQESQASVWNRETGLPVFTQPVPIYDGIVRVRTFIQNPENHGEPRLFFDPKCKGTLKEFGLYRYNTAVEGRAEREDPIKADDHAMDALRYGLVANFGLSDIARPRRRNREVIETLERV